METPLLSISEAARVMGLSRGLLYRRIRGGELRTYTSGRNRRAVYLKRTDLDGVMNDVSLAEPVRRSAPAARVEVGPMTRQQTRAHLYCRVSSSAQEDNTSWPPRRTPAGAGARAWHRGRLGRP